jgi:hypothetical protein
LGGNKLEEKQYVSISWPKAKEVVMAIGCYSTVSDPVGLFDWPLIGLKFIPHAQVGYKWRFEIVDKKKLSYFMIKYGFTL